MTHRLRTLLLFSLLVFVIFIAYNATSIAVRAASVTPPPVGPSFTCYGGSVFLYSRDFSDSPIKNPTRPAEGIELRCPNSQLTRFALNQKLAGSEVCGLTPTAANSCGVAYYAIVPSRSGNLDVLYDVAGGLCTVKGQGQPVTFKDCLAKEASMHKDAPYFVYSGTATYASLPKIPSSPSPPSSGSVADFIKRNGVRVEPLRGGSGVIPRGGILRFEWPI